MISEKKFKILALLLGEIARSEIMMKTHHVLKDLLILPELEH